MEKKQEKRIVVGLIVVVIIASFFVGYSFYSNKETTYSFEGATGTFDFTKSVQGDYWLNWSSKQQISGNVYKVYDWITPFPYGPNELTDIPIDRYNSVRVRTKASHELYVTRDVSLDDKYDPTLDKSINPKGGIYISLLSLQRVLDKYSIDSKLASIETNTRSRELELPTITCENATESMPVIFFKEGPETQISIENDYCFIAQFKEGEDPNRVGTALAYHIIGVL